MNISCVFSELSVGGPWWSMDDQSVVRGDSVQLSKWSVGVKEYSLGDQ